jgi:membrane protease YdiL (CAAX protease family)
MAWTPVNLPPPGWYPDPAGQLGFRWWDGHDWTWHVVPYPAPHPGQRVGDHREPEQRGRIPTRAAWWGLAGVAVGFILGGILQGLALLAFPGSDAAQILMGVAGLWTGLGGTCVFVSRKYGTGSLTEDFGLGFRPSDIWAGLLAALACFFVVGVVGGIFTGTRFHGSNTNIIRNQAGSTVGVAIVTVIVAIGAPFFEELFFRGFLRQAFATRIGLASIPAQAVCFGLAHYQFGLGLGNVSVVTATAALGVVLGYTAYLTKRLGAGMIAHGLFNFIVTLTIVAVVR